MSALTLNPDELGPDPIAGLDLACDLGIKNIEVRSAWGRNALLLTDDEIDTLQQLIERRGLSVAALASPLWKWCLPSVRPRQVDTFGFATQVPLEQRRRWIHRALAVVTRLGTQRVRVFSHLRVEPEWDTEPFVGDPLVDTALDAAEDAGVRLLLENEPVCTTASVSSVRAALRCYAPRLGLWWDVGNAHELGEDVITATEQLADYVDYVHIKDLTSTVDGRRVFCPAGTGTVPYSAVLPILATHAPQAPWATGSEGAALVRSRPGGDSAAP